MAETTLPRRCELDQELVRRVQRGDSAAFDLLVRKYQHRIAALIGRYIPDWSECQDVAQETFIRAYRAIANFRGDAQFYTWLHRIAVNTAKNHLVAQNRRPPTDDVDADDAEQFDTGTRLRDNDTPGARTAAAGNRTHGDARGRSLPEELRSRDHPARGRRPELRGDRRRGWIARSAPCVRGSSARARRSTHELRPLLDHDRTGACAPMTADIPVRQRLHPREPSARCSMASCAAMPRASR